MTLTGGERLLPTDPYQLPSEGIDVPAMVGRAQARLPGLRRHAVVAALHSEAWHEGEYPSLRTFHFRELYKRYSSIIGEPVHVFDHKTGAINVPFDTLATSSIGEFFTSQRIRRQEEFTQLRGLTYYVSLDFSKETPQQKMEVMIQDVKEGLDIISSVDRKTLSAMDYLLYLGVLDHFKAHALIAFHALTFHERTGVIPDDNEYMNTRRRAERLMLKSTRGYHQAILGQPFDTEFNPGEVRSDLEMIADYIVRSGHSGTHFNYLEITNPVIILLGAHEAARNKVLPDLIIGIPSGGTEVAVATHLMCEKLYSDRTVPGISFVPLSFHHRAQGGIDVDRLAEMLGRITDIAGKKVLIVDDNSNTGSTIQRMATAAAIAGASDIKVHIAEIDPTRVMAKHKRENGLPYGVVNMDHPDFLTALGVSWTSDGDGRDLRRALLKKFVYSAHRRAKRETREV